MGDTFDESGIFSESLSIWKGLKQNKDGSLSYEDGDFDPIPLDLFAAASIGEEEIVQDILDSKSIRVNTTNRGGWSALMYAAYMGHDCTVQCLLECGADPNQRSPQGYSSLILSSMCGNDNIMHHLLQRRVNLEATDKRGWSALFHAVSAGHQRTTELLIKWGANCEMVEPSQGLTPLMEAAASGHELIVTLLLEKGVDISKVDFNGDNARSLAKVYGHINIVRAIEQYKPKRRQSGTKKGYPQNNSKQKPGGNPCGRSGPSIHDGPMAFAQMTGLDPSGKPQPHAAVPFFMQDNPFPAETPKPVKWEGPKDLEALLKEIGCSKHYVKFKDQDIDLHVFLTLSEADLKEIGVNLFGPRRKMVSAISRLSSEIQASISDAAENIYADTLNAKMQSLIADLNKVKKEKEELSAQVANERELRQVAESCLMEYKETWSNLRRWTEKCTSSQAQLLETVEQLKLHALSLHPEHNPNANRGGAYNQRRKHDSLIKQVRELATISHHSNELVQKMHNTLQRSSWKNVAASTTKSNATAPG
uniref:Ankyrin repeat and SAM domain-containing protein 3 n=1 Tax=Phallusia mammillata TaxID=59560 RepID=A0A6F9D739_9ASCI|nr:ankyrin repeat and SAM domain-containing protein 3 [Phallusia mammillata]